MVSLIHVPRCLARSRCYWHCVRPRRMYSTTAAVSGVNEVSVNSSSRSQRHLPGLPSVGDLMRLYRVQALKQLSQNFLMEPGVCRRVALAGGGLQNAHVLEVGPGPGNLTRPILQALPASLTVVERDTRFLPGLIVLRDAAVGLAGDQEASTVMHIVAGDVLSYDVGEAFRDLPAAPWEDFRRDARIVGNLPFNISTPLLIRWLRQISERKAVWARGRVRMALTFQKEVAERLAAPADHAQRCRFSVIAQNYCHVEHRFTIPSRLFVPRPEVDVGVVVLTPHERPLIANHRFEVIEKVARCLFNMRQKQLARGVGNLYPEPYRKQLAADTLRLAELPIQLRPFQLSVEEVGRLCDAYKDICRLHPHLAEYEHRAPGDNAAWEEDELLKKVVRCDETSV